MTRTSLTRALACLIAFAGVAVAQPTDDDLPFVERNGEKIPLFMHEGTFDGGNGSGWARDDVEIEAASTMSCIPGEELYEMLEGNDRRNFRRLRRSPAMEAYSVGGFDTDEIPWGSDTHDVREGNIPWLDGDPLPTNVWLTLENDRFPIDEERGRRRLAMGTDIMDDIYYDTDDFLLRKNGMSIRARKRWDTATEMRRLLIALKVEAGVDSFGIKRAAKTDVRRDSPSADAINGLTEAVSRGLDSWSHEPAVPLRRAYEILKARGVLFDTPTYKQCLVLKPKAFIRSVRSRYHLNETRISDMTSLYNLGRSRLEALVTMSRETRQDGAVPPGRVADLEAWEAKVTSFLSGDLVAERAKAGLAELDFDATDAASIADLMPGSSGPGSASDLADLSERKVIIDRRRVVAEAINSIMHELADELDDGSSESLRRLITRSMDRSLERHVEFWEDYNKAITPNLRRIRTGDRFEELHAEAMGDADALKAYNTFGENRRTGDWAVLEFLNGPSLTDPAERQRLADESNRSINVINGICERILEARPNQPNERFADMDAVDEISGIGPGTIAILRELRDRDRDWRRFTPLTADQFDELRFQMRNETARIWIRQIESAGSAVQGLWFDEARQFFVPRSRRTTSNFLIDTMDFAAMYEADVWGDMPEAERTAAVDLSQPPYADKLIHSTVVNEVQIELLSGTEYTRRLKELKSLTALPRFFMLWATDTGQASNPDEYKALFEELKALSDDELKVKLVAFNDFMKANDSPIGAIEPDELRDWIDPERLRDDVRDDPDYSEPLIDEALKGAEFVFEQYRDMLQHIAKLKEDRVRSTLDRAGAPNCMEWVAAEGSKGSIAIGIIKRRAEAAGSSGLSGAVNSATSGSNNP